MPPPTTSKAYVLKGEKLKLIREAHTWYIVSNFFVERIVPTNVCVLA
jgi:hypothetical protein